MTARRVVPAVFAAAVAAACAIVLIGDSDGYLVRLEMDNASGIRDGSRVTVAGAPVGKVSRISLGRDDVVRVDLELDKGKEIGHGARADVKAANLLATKFIDLDPGDLSRPAPSGALIPSSRIRTSVDVDELINVLDPDTRARLGILLNEAGLALAGRRADLNKLIGRLPATLDDASHLLRELSTQNHALGSLVESSDRFLARLDPERRQLGNVLASASETMRTVAARREQLQATLKRAPRSLSTLRRFLAELRATTQPLGPAARALSATAPSLAGTLTQLAPFERAARPTLATATATAPALTRLGAQATPVIGRSIPTIEALTTFSKELAPITKTLGRGGTGGVRKRRSPGAIDDLLGTATSWASGASDRDTAGHIFHGIVTIGADTLLSAVNSYAQILKGAPAKPHPRAKREAKRKRSTPAKAPTPAPAASTPAPTGAPQLPTEPVQEVAERATSLLDYLLEP